MRETEFSMCEIELSMREIEFSRRELISQCMSPDPPSTLPTLLSPYMTTLPTLTDGGPVRTSAGDTAAGTTFAMSSTELSPLLLTTVTLLPSIFSTWNGPSQATSRN
jgi:hypothetical protein